MTFLRPRNRSPWLALVALLGALFTADGASACTTMGGGGACPPAETCGCCEAPASPTLGREAAAPGVGLLRGATACEASPAGCCVCTSERPTAPEPESKQGPSDQRNATVRDLGPVEPFALTALRTPTRSVPVPVGPAWRAPLYLRTSRLLI